MNESIINKFLNTLSSNKKITRDEFYESFFDFLEENEIALSPTERDDLEIIAFHKAKELGFIGYDIIVSISDMDDFNKKISLHALTKKNMLFHIFYEDDMDSSLNEIWRKWNNIPPMGWIAGWCSCGEFFPYTVDLGMINLNKYEIEENNIRRPMLIKLKMVQRVDFCTNGIMRLILDEDTILLVKPFILDTGLAYKFLDNPLKILEC